MTGETEQVSTNVSHREALELAAAARNRARSLGLRPICVAVVDTGAHVKHLELEDGASFFRADIALAKAWTAVAMQASTSEIGIRFKDREGFLGALNVLAGGKVVGVPGGILLIRGGVPVGGIGVSGDVSASDEDCALAAVMAVFPDAASGG